MNSTHVLHTATLLPDGNVLVASGSSWFFNAQVTNICELYNPATGIWLETGGLNIARWQHTASLIVLPRRFSHCENQRCDKARWEVLVAGGQDITGVPIASAELYDPISKTWHITGTMTVPRVQHTSTVLHNGKVLVAGGSGVQSAEIYDPATEEWTATTPMNSIRYNHTATLLRNGKVLVAGGLGGKVQSSSAELFDPRTGTWTATGSMNSAREYHSATLLNDGTVLVAGGVSIYSGYLSSSEIYDPVTGSWTMVTNQMNTIRGHHTATLLFNGQVLITGGYGGGSSALSSAEIFNPSNQTWTVVSEPMTSPRTYHTATTLRDRKILITGGVNAVFNPVALNSSELFDPKVYFQSGFTSASNPESLSPLSVEAPMVNLTNPKLSPDGVFQFSFLHSPGTLFGVLATTNILSPRTNWTRLDGLIEIAPGQFQFIDAQAMNNAKRFYSVFPQ